MADEPRETTQGWLQTLEALSKVFAVVLTPVVVGMVGNSYTASIKEREREVEIMKLIPQLLSQELPGIRLWAVDVIGSYSGIEVPQQVKDQIEDAPLQITRSTAGMNFRALGGGRSITEVIIADTQSETLQDEIDGLQEERVSYHYLIDPSGAIEQLVDEEDVAYHTRARNLNSIGIGLIHVSGRPYPDAQYQALIGLLREVTQRHGIALEQLYPKSEVDPTRRTDLAERMSEMLTELREGAR